MKTSQRDHLAPPSQRPKFRYQSQVFKGPAGGGQTRPKHCESNQNNTLNLKTSVPSYRSMNLLSRLAGLHLGLRLTAKSEKNRAKHVELITETSLPHTITAELRLKKKRKGFSLSLSQQTLHSNNSTSILANPIMEENPGEENGMTQNKYFLSGFGATRSKHFSSHPASAVTPDLN